MYDFPSTPYFHISLRCRGHHPAASAPEGTAAVHSLTKQKATEPISPEPQRSHVRPHECFLLEANVMGILSKSCPESLHNFFSSPSSEFWSVHKQVRVLSGVPSILLKDSLSCRAAGRLSGWRLVMWYVSVLSVGF